MKKKVLALALVAVLALSSTSAFAAEATNCTKVNNNNCNNLINNCTSKTSNNQYKIIINGKVVDLNSTNLRALLNQDAAKAPVAKPAAPVAAPTTPVAKPTTPVAAPTAPVAKPTTPVTAPAAPVEKPSTTQNNTTVSSSNLTYEQKVVELVNIERQKAGLQTLKMDSAISNVARTKSKDMAVNNYFAHQSPTYGSAGDMLKKFGISWSAWGENIAAGQQTPEIVVNAWMNSPGHRANILSSNFNKIGVGYVTNSNGTPYWTQIFTN